MRGLPTPLYASGMEALRWRTPFQLVCDAWARDRAPFKINPHHLIPGPYTPRAEGEGGERSQCRRPSLPSRRSTVRCSRAPLRRPSALRDVQHAAGIPAAARAESW
jgi:hypothetical protein